MTLAELQRAFHAAITGAAPLASARSLVHKGGIDPIERLHVYANAYHARIHGVLVADFPKLHAVLGEDAFRALVVPYLRAYPTRHPSLREAGAHLAEYLVDPHHADLARLERARVEAHDGPDVAPLARAALAALGPDAFPALRLRLVPTAVLVELSTNADELWDAVEDGRPLPAFASARRTVAVWRRDVTVIHRTLDPDEVEPLRRVADGATFAEICDDLALAEADGERALAQLLRWLDAGLLA